MDAPRLPPVVAGRSALPAFLEVEAWARERTARARSEAADRLEAARADAERVRREGEAALQEVVLEGEHEALRDVQGRARDRVSEARKQVRAWIDEAERAAQEALGAALDVLCAPPGPEEG
jgi:vacuolar-type H+-ATPase subunit H